MFTAHPSCTACELCKVARSVGTPSIIEHSTGAPGLIFIGRNPGFHEDQQGVPFVGRSGIILRGGMVGAEHMPGVYIDGPGLRSLATIYITNAVRCYTLDDAEPVWTKHVKPCWPHTASDLRTISALHDRFVLCCLGTVASQAVYAFLLGHKKKMSGRDASKRNGELIDFFGKPAHLFSLIHPAFLDREPNNIISLSMQLDLVKDALLGTLPVPSRPNIVPPFSPGAPR